MMQDPSDDDRYVCIGSSNGLVLPVNKPLAEPVLTKFHDAISHH